MLNLVDFIPPSALTVMEFGCGDGINGETFKKIQPKCRYIGVDTDEKLLQKAQGHLDQVAWESFLSMELNKHGIRDIDCFIYNSKFIDFSCLQKKLLEQQKALNDNGQMLFLIENVGYYRNVMSLWQGKKPMAYSNFTLNQLIEVIKECHMEIDHIYPQYDETDETERNLPSTQALIQSFINYCKEKKVSVKTDLWAKTFIIRAVSAKWVKPRLLVQTVIGEAIACSRVRIHEPHMFCRTQFGIDTVDQREGIDFKLGEQYKNKIIIRQRMQMRNVDDLYDIENKILAQNYALIYEIDDNPVLWEKEYKKMCFADFRCCHAVQVSTEALREYMLQFNANVVVFENQLKYLPRKSFYDEKKPITLFFGALNRTRDWQDIMPIINEALHKYKNNLFVYVMFDKNFFEALQTDNKKFWSGFSPYSVYENVMQTSDISLLPLLDNPFNRMKSDLKFIESAGHSSVALASPTVYSSTIKNGRTGFIYHNKKEFREYLFMLIENNDLRMDMAAAAYAYVRDNRLLAQHYEERCSFYSKLLTNLSGLNDNLYNVIGQVRKEINKLH